MNKNVHFLPEITISNNNKRIYDMQFINENILSISDISGAIHYYTLNENSNPKLTKTLQLYKREEENSIFSIDNISDMTIAGSSKGDIIILKNEKKIKTFNINKHNKENQSISKCIFLNENLYTYGDSSGQIIIKDIRTDKIIKSYQEQSEEITDIVHTELKDNFILSSSIDGTLGVYDIRQKKIFALSDCIEEEINSLEIVKNSNNILASTSEGYIEIFNWGWFGDFKDRIKGHPQSVLCMDKYDENLIISGCEDGGVRICSVCPKGVRGIICDKEKVTIDNEEFNEVNCICVSKDKSFICSCCNISFVKVYDCRNIDFSKIYPNPKDEEFNESFNSENDEDKIENESENYDDDDFNSDEDEGSENESDNESEKISLSKKKMRENKNEVKGNINLKNRKINEDDIPDISDEIIDEEENEDEDEEEENEESEKNDKYEKEESKEYEKNEKLNNDINLIESENEEKSNDKDESSDDDSSISDDSSKKKKKKSKKIKTLGKKRKSNNLIETERRKAFFNDL